MSTKEPIPDSKSGAVSSLRGREWLNNFCQFEAGEHVSEKMEISIPDVSPFGTVGGTGVDIDHDTLSNILSSTPGKENFQPEGPSPTAFPETTLPRNASLSELAFAEEVQKAEVESSALEKAKVEPTNNQASNNVDESGKCQSLREAIAKHPGFADLEPLLRTIEDRFPAVGPITLLFVGSETNRHTHETCARAAQVLAELQSTRVLLIDSDHQTQELTKAAGLLSSPGITDVVNHGKDWDTMLFGGSTPDLDFLPVGAMPLEIRKDYPRLRSALNQMKEKYRFVCVAGGDAHQRSSSIWHELCDGSFLIVSLKNSNEKIAKSAVTQLQQSGARLLGCIVSDSK
ncbi:MAG: hypothetical protein AAF939_14260 [Planctomycetota bacterium]